MRYQIRLEEEATVRLRDIKLSDYDISRAEYNELKYFCMQYGEKRRELEKGYGVREVIADGMPKGNVLGNPTAQEAIKKATLQNDIDLIEKTVHEAAETLYPWILKNVTEGVPYEWLNVPCGRRQFYERRRYFFYLLAQKR